MGKRVTQRRQVAAEEIQVLRAALEVAFVDGSRANLLATLESLRVVDGCACGCASIEFEAPGDSPASTLIADALGVTPSGGQVGVIVWGTDDCITGLEVYGLGAGDDDLNLPVPESLHPLHDTESHGAV